MKFLGKLYFCGVASLLMAVGLAQAAAQNAPDRLILIAFDRLDHNQDGFLTPEEVAGAPRLRRMFSYADRDGDGRVSARQLQQATRTLENRNQDSRLHPAGIEATSILDASGPWSVDVDGVTRRYILFVPTGVDPQSPLPLVVAFHGGGGNPEAIIQGSGLNEKAQEEGFAVAYPYGTGTSPDAFLSWNGGNCCSYAQEQNVDDVRFVELMLDDIARRIRVNRKQVFAAGLSNGGIMAYRVAAELSEDFAAIASVAGTTGQLSIQPTHPVAILHFHGLSDLLLPYKGGFGETPSGAPGEVEYLAVDQALTQWSAANLCTGPATIETLPNPIADGTRATRHARRHCAGDTAVEIVLIEGGGHTWPGEPPLREFLGRSTQDFSANDLMWEFFQTHARSDEINILPRGSTVPINEGELEIIRTPDTRFDDLPDFDFEPRYVFVDDPEGRPGNQRIRVHYIVSGPPSGPTLYMMHGNPSWSFLFRRLIPIINEAGYRTIAVDHVGHGRSDKLVDESAYSYDRHLEWMRQAFEQIDEDPDLNLGRVVLFGHDYGHPFGARLQAEHYPDRFDGFINGNAGLNRGLNGIAPRHEQWRDFVRNSDFVPVGAVICRGQARQQQGVAPCPLEVEDGYDAPYPDRTYQASVRTFPEFVPEDESRSEAIANQAAWDYLLTYERPYMVIWEPADLPDDRNRRSDYIGSIPGAFGQRPPQFATGHYSPEDDPDAVAGAIIEFMDELFASQRFETVLATDFSTASDLFNCPASSCWRQSDSLELRDSDEGIETRSSINLSGADAVKFAFQYHADLTMPGDLLELDLWDGSAWQSVVSLSASGAGTQGDFSNGSTDYGFVRLSSEQFSLSESTRVRIRFSASDRIATVNLLNFAAFARSSEEAHNQSLLSEPAGHLGREFEQSDSAGTLPIHPRY